MTVLMPRRGASVGAAAAGSACNGSPLPPILQHLRLVPLGVQASRQAAHPASNLLPQLELRRAQYATTSTSTGTGTARARSRRRLASVATAAAAGSPPTGPGSHGDGHAASQPPPADMPPYASWPGTARVALRTGCYITVLGLAVFALPASVFGAVFDANRVTLGWVRVGGVLASLFGAYYVGAALDDAAGRCPRYFYACTIGGRLLLSAAFMWLVLSGQSEPGLLWLAAANAASSLLLWRAVQQRQWQEQQHLLQQQ